VTRVDSNALHAATVAKLGFAAVRGKHLGMVIHKLRAALPVSCHPRSVKDALLHWKANPRGAECKF
jgi:hypothetical protein